jgi:hypothetical protein
MFIENVVMKAEVENVKDVIKEVEETVTQCSLNVPSLNSSLKLYMELQCSLNVHLMFSGCCLNVPSLKSPLNLYMELR